MLEPPVMDVSAGLPPIPAMRSVPVNPDATPTATRPVPDPPTIDGVYRFTVAEPALMVRIVRALVMLSVAAIPAVMVTVAAEITTNPPPAAIVGEVLERSRSELTVIDWSMLTMKLFA